MRQNTPPKRLYNRVDVVWNCATPIELPWMRFGKRWALAFLRGLHLHGCTLSLAWLSNAAMRKLNAQFRGQNKTTDVLSFPSGEMPPNQAYAGLKNAATFVGFLGDIAIALPVACRQAQQWGTRPQTEAKLYLAHGLLHLLGHNHHAKADARKMALWERKLLQHKGMLLR
ncbi:MAG: rRNA maturation RNase YbeY [Cystobacterineae bacterium]|nr:rRNA maturation RNase YbeY [Cystobacterineae bacterium]